MDKVFFKIIIPNYNNYIYIKKCLDSILEQTFTDWHCIIVDDMSTDNSDRIAEIYARRHPDKFTFLRMTEKGHEGGARNLGIDYPLTCQYYYFVDSDDYLYDNTALEDVHKNLIENQVDVLFIRMLELKNNTSQLIPQAKFNWENYKSFMHYGSACTKFVKCDKIVKFLENCDHSPDAYQCMKLLDQSPSVGQLDRIVYVYRKNRTSITSSGRYQRDTNIFYNNLRALLKNTRNEWVRKAIEYRIKLHDNGMLNI